MAATMLMYVIMPMLKPLLLPWLILATTVAAGAQQNIVPMPMTPQMAPPVAQGGIAEQGRGSVSVPADRLRLTVHVYNPGPPGATPVVRNDAARGGSALDELVAAMRANGIADAHIVTPTFGAFGNGMQVAGTIAKPTSAKVGEIEERVVAKLSPSSQTMLRNVNIQGTLETDDCSSAIDRARKLAYADAHKRAEALASVAGVRLGVLLAANEYDQTFGCATETQSSGAYINANINGNDTNSKFEIIVSTSVNATFAIAH